MKQMNCLW